MALLSSLKLGLLFASSSESFTTLTNWSSQHSLRINLKSLLIHMSKGCSLYKHFAETFTTPVWRVNIAATSSVKWSLNASITIKGFWKPISFVLSRTYTSHIFSYHTTIKRSFIQAFFWVTIQGLSGTVRSLIVRSVLPRKMINGGKNISTCGYG